LNKQKGWDWGKKGKDWLNKIEVGWDPTGVFVVNYPNSRTVTVVQRQLGYSLSPISLSKSDLKNYYYGPTLIDFSNGNSRVSGSVFIPIPNLPPISIPVPAPMPLPILG
jgi:hypothetical protein